MRRVHLEDQRGQPLIVVLACMSTRSSRRDLVSVLAQLRGELRRCTREIEDLRIENEILRDAAAPLIHQAPAGERFAFVHARRGRFGVKRLCGVLVTDGGNYRAWVRGQANRRRRHQLLPNEEGRLYLATAVDLCSKEVVGYAMAPHMRASLAVEAISAAHRTGLLAGNAIMHTDRGGQYHAKAFRNVLRRLDIRQCCTGRERTPLVAKNSRVLGMRGGGSPRDAFARCKSRQAERRSS